MGTYLIYKFIYPDPRTWYEHYLYLAQSFLKLRVDVPNLPSFYQDAISVSGKTYLPFPPIPAVVLIPFILVLKNITQQSVSVVIGAVNTLLVYLLLKKCTNTKNSFILSIFFAFGSVAFWASVVGTTWYFAHTVAITFFVLSLISHKNKKDFLSGILFSLAVLSRYPIFLGIIFYVLELYKDKKRLILFMSGALTCIPVQLFYNWARFGNLLQTGYIEVYKNYINSNYPFTIRQLVSPGASYFRYMDIRNIPLHLYTLLIMPPVVRGLTNIAPSPYGMGIIFTTPLLFLVLKHFTQSKELLRNLFLGAAGIATIDFLHYMQGWVQFGYRFLLDFLPFLLIILAIKFKPTKILIALLVMSVIVNTWGVFWGIKLDW